MTPKKENEFHDETETEHRREAALKRMLNTPHKPHRPLKDGRKTVKARKGPKAE